VVAIADSRAVPSSPARRLAAIDVLRGFVMVLMAIDHSSEAFNAGRIMSDAAWLYKPGTPLPAGQFFTRWITHLCAPSFVFLAGTALALYVKQRESKGESAWSIDRHIATRGAVIAAFELWVSFFWMPPGRVLFQVLYAIGTSFILMALLRRLPTWGLVAFAAAILVLGEWVTGAMGWGPPERTPLWAALLLVPGFRGHIIVAYPTLPWLAIMLLGWAFGRYLTRRPDVRETQRQLAWGGVALLAMYAVLRGLNSFGNMGLLRADGSVVQWLHVSKYPPSLTYVGLELGIAGLALAALWRPTVSEDSGPGRVDGPLLVFGRTPMFFYLLHIPLLALLAKVSGLHGVMGLGATYAFALVVVAMLYLPCRAYAGYKGRGGAWWTRYV
jgi:uncharacterized membrane protein